MKKLFKVIVVIVSIVAFLVGSSVITWFWFSRRAFPKTSGKISVGGIRAPVYIVRDSDGIPHIYAQNTEDLYFAQGYVHAQDRFWQMELWRRIGSGRLSEYFGERTVEADIYLRTVGYSRIAEREYELFDDGTKKILDSYAAGVNAYIQNRKPVKLGLEFSLLKMGGVEVEIEPWTPVNTLTWSKVMSESMSSGFRHELLRVEIIANVGVEMASDFFSPYRYDEMPVVINEDEKISANRPSEKLEIKTDQPERELTASGLEYSDTLLSSFRRLSNRIGRLGDILHELDHGYGVGSNGWVISGALSESEGPILANDPHLGVQMPSIWYEIGLHLEDVQQEPFDVRGYSFPGSPGVVIGHNNHIAWGFTNSDPDVQDLYIERINPFNPDQYEVNGEWRDMEIIYEKISVFDHDEPIVLPVRMTRHGPIVSDYGAVINFSSFGIKPLQIFPENLVFEALALRWTAFSLNNTIQALFLLNRARNFTEFREALQFWDVPSQNVLYADREGNIGYQLPGLIPIRKNGDGTLPVPGWVDDYEWVGFVPFEELPMLYNPKSGYIVTANNPAVSPGFSYNLGMELDFGYRARRIVDLIEGKSSPLTVDDMRLIQGDTLNLSTFEVLPYLEDLNLEEEMHQIFRDKLLAWDRQMDVDSSGAALYGLFYISLIEETFADQLPETQWRPEKLPGNVSLLQNTIYYLLHDPTNPWWDDRGTTEAVETRDDILAGALEKASIRGTEIFGENPEAWRWGAVHTTTFQNQTFGKSGIGLLKRVYNRGPVEVGGGNAQVISNEFKLEEPFDVWLIPSMRMIVDLSNLSNTFMMHTTGQSGHPGHPHYDDFILPWSEVEYHPSRWEKTDVEENAEGVLVLRPQK
jgi:penicillin amidase